LLVNALTATLFREKAGQTVGGEQHESKDFWSHHSVGDVTGGQWRKMDMVTLN